VVLYVRDNIPFSERKDLVSKDLEMVCIEINRPYNKSPLIMRGIDHQTQI
jgi:hypothetical protein